MPPIPPAVPGLPGLDPLAPAVQGLHELDLLCREDHRRLPLRPVYGQSRYVHQLTVCFLA